LREIRCTNSKIKRGSSFSRNHSVTVFVCLPEAVLRRFRSECGSG
jgi:hypothetical protein